MNCPHCAAFIDPPTVLAEAGRIRHTMKQSNGGGRPKKIEPCEFCGRPLGVREMVRHRPKCVRHPRG